MLLDANVNFIIIGGYSVIFHGYKRTTGDIDIWLKPDNDNKKKLLPVLKQFGFEDDEVNAVSNIDFTQHTVFSMGEEPEKIDFLTRINLVQYDEADNNKVVAEVDELQIPFLHLNDLILSKINTGRSKDKADIDMLQQVANERKQSM
jgi:predicted nucleotidyltransferase